MKPALFRSVLALALGLAVFPLVERQAAAADPQAIGTFGDWQAVTFEEDGKTGCYITSRPKSEQGDYSQRGQVYVLVTHRPADASFDVVSFVAGYTFREGADVGVSIDAEKFALFTNQDSAWAVDGATDRALVAAMKSGNRMVVEGTSSRGTKTTDTYSLSGFTRAYNAIAEACPR